MRKFILFIFLVGVVFNSAGQGSRKKNQPVDIIRHEVQLGETVRMISLKYLVTPADIYYLNKFATSGIKQGMVLQIPVPRKETVLDVPENEPTADQITGGEKTVDGQPAQKKIVLVTVVDRTSERKYTVGPHETLYSIAKKYNVSPDEIKLSNQKLFKSGMKVGMTIKIPGSRVLAADESSIGGEETPVNEVSSDKGSGKR